ncbi:MAG: UvrD-helicase domain-containing protein [Bacteroidota bacterium]
MSFLVYRSSAGSGKTYTLVKEYLKVVLLRPDSFRNILAITFTNKAANEMKERLMLFLTGLAKEEIEQEDSIKALSATLSEEIGLSDAIIRKRSEIVLGLILHHYSDLAIGTIDSFVARVIRTFARDLHLSQSFEIELDQSSVIANAVEKLMQQLGKDECLTEALLEFTLEKVEEEKGWNIEKDLAGFASDILFQEEGQHALSALEHLTLSDFSEIRKKLRTLRYGFESQVNKQASVLYKMLIDNDLPFEAFYYGMNGVFGNLRNLSANPLMDKYLSTNSYVQKALNQDVWLGPKASIAHKSTFDRLGQDFKDGFKALHEFIEKQLPNYLIRKALYSNLWALSLLHEINHAVEEIKAENNILPIIEFNRRISEVVLNEPIPFIYERLGERYHYFLIDEFQDTSILQWQNMLPLIENALSEAYLVIIVGDGKQAIYRWRGGEVEQFASLPEVYRNPEGLIHRQRESALIRSYQEAVLGTNYRSGKFIVDFNNEFFINTSVVLSEMFQKSIYAENLIRQKPQESKTGGMVSLEFVPDEANGLEYNDLMLHRIRDIIQEVIHSGYTYGDIAILGRANVNIGVTAEFLIGSGIPVQSPDLLKISASGKVNFLISCLRWTVNPEDRISRRAMEIFVQSASNLSIRELKLGELQKLPVYDLSEELIRHFKLAEESDPYLLFFLDAVNDYSRRNDVTVTGFLDWWEVQGNSKVILTPDEVPAVRLLTVHKAKGLQFPVVILPFLPAAMKITLKYLWADIMDEEIPEIQKVLLKTLKDLDATTFSAQFREEENKSRLDYLNLLYVAMTRPEDRLYILSDLPSKTPETGFNTADFLFRFAKMKGHVDLSQCYIQGEKSQKKKKKISPDKDKNVFHLTSSLSSSWKDKLFIRYNSPSAWDVIQPTRTREKGELLHQVMAGISDIHSWDFELKKMYSKGIFDQDNLEEIRENVRKVIFHPELQQFFSGDIQILAEKEILLPDGKVIRPDRVVCLPERTVILDYKTGEKSEHHLDQIRDYSNILSAMQYPAVEAYLVYMEKGIEVVKA